MTNEEINEAVARKLGFVIETGHKVYIEGDYVDVPPYSTSIEAAWEILTDHCDEWHLDCRGTVTARLMQNYVDSGEVTAETAPLAICKAFLALEEK